MRDPEKLAPVKIPDTDDLIDLIEKSNTVAALIMLHGGASGISGLDRGLVQDARRGRQRLDNKRRRLDEIERDPQS